MSLNVKLACQKNNRSLLFSESQKIPTLESPCRSLASFTTGMVGPRVGIFLSPLNTNGGFYLIHIPIPACGKVKYVLKMYPLEAKNAPKN